MRVIFDTNILLSLSVSRSGTLYAIRQAWRDLRFEVLVSDTLIEEITRVLTYPQVAKWLGEEGRAALFNLLDSAEWVEIQPPLPTFDDPKDAFLLAMLRDGQADCLVTGDKQLLALGAFEGRAIISAIEFWDRLDGTR